MNEIMEVQEKPKNSGRFWAILLSVVIAVVSFCVVGEIAQDPVTYAATIESIDEKKATVMAVTTAAAVTSVVLAAVPSDATTPVANEIMDIGSYLMIVVCALVLEKSLLTLLGAFAFKILIPLACVMFIISTCQRSEMWKDMAIKVVIFALALACVVPISIKVGDMICAVNSDTIDAVVDDIEADYDVDKKSDKKAEKGLKALWNKAKETVEDTVSAVTETTKDLTNKFIDAIAVFIIAYCAIPILVFVLMGWMLKLLFGIKVSVPTKNPIQAVGRKAIGKVAKGTPNEE